MIGIVRGRKTAETVGQTYQLRAYGVDVIVYSEEELYSIYRAGDTIVCVEDGIVKETIC